jgi:hypothetical protein
MSSHPSPLSAREEGFSLVETLISMALLATALISLAGVFTAGLASLAGSSSALIAREKAREAVESVHTARDTGAITWARIRNVADGGWFVPGAQPLRTAGDDGLVNTADDTGYEESVQPGADHLLGTDDDVRVPLDRFRRQIEITDLVTNGVVDQNLRQLRVTITYPVGQWTRTYTLTTFISSIS